MNGYISAHDGINKLAFGGCIAGYKRSFILKAGSPGLATPDLFWGFLAALDDGYFVVSEPHHVHTDAANPDNNGFGGRMAYWGSKGDEATLAKLNELNRFQMFGHYYECAAGQQRLYPDAPIEARTTIANAMLGQAVGWYADRVKLHQMGIEPMSMNTCDLDGMNERKKLSANDKIWGPTV